MLVAGCIIMQRLTDQNFIPLSGVISAEDRREKKDYKEFLLENIEVPEEEQAEQLQNASKKCLLVIYCVADSKCVVLGTIPNVPITDVTIHNLINSTTSNSI